MHDPVTASHAVLKHSESATHPRQTLPITSQTGIAPEHCEESTHWTHTWLGEQCAALLGQSESDVHAGAASAGGAVSHSWSRQTNPSVQGRLVSITPNELQSAGETQQTTGLGLEHDAPRTNTTKQDNRICRRCIGRERDVNEPGPDEGIRCISLHIGLPTRRLRRKSASGFP